MQKSAKRIFKRNLNWLSVLCQPFFPDRYWRNFLRYCIFTEKFEIRWVFIFFLTKARKARIRIKIKRPFNSRTQIQLHDEPFFAEE